MLSHEIASGVGPVDTSHSRHASLKTLKFMQVSLHEGFWTRKLAVNRKRSLRFGFEMLEKAGNLDNLRIAAGLIKGTYRGYVFQDSDIYKWLEAVAWEMGQASDQELVGPGGSSDRSDSRDAATRRLYQ